MSILDSPSVSPPLHDSFDTTADHDLSMAEDGPAAEWQALIDHTLIEWGCNPSLCEDEGIAPPTAEIVSKAVRLAQVFMQKNLPAPDRVVPDPDGGIVFERHSGAMVEVLHIWDDASVEVLCLQNGRVTERVPIESF